MNNPINAIIFDLVESMPDMAFMVARDKEENINLFCAFSDVKLYDEMTPTQKRQLQVQIVARVDFVAGKLIGKGKVAKIFLCREMGMCFSHFSASNVDE